MPPIWSSLDAAEIIRAAFDEATGTFRTTATAVIIGGDVTVDIDGVYNALINPDPDNIGLIAHNRASSPLDSDQVNRITSVNNITVHALDVALHHSDATDIDSGNPLFIAAIDLDIRNLDQSLDSIRIGDGTNFFTSTSVSGKQGLDVNIINASVIIADPVTVNQGTNPWIVDGSGFTQPISAISLPLPTGASTEAQQIIENGLLTSIDNKLVSLTTAPDINELGLIVRNLESSIEEILLNNATIATTTPILVTSDLALDKEINCSVVINGPVTGGSPTLQFTVYDVDPATGNLTSHATMSPVYTSPIVANIFTHYTKTGHIQVVADVTGTTPSFGGAYLSIAVKNAQDMSVMENSLSSIDSKIPSGLTVVATRLLVDGSGAIQPISGTVTANQGTSPWVIGDGGGSITVDGTVTANQGGAPWSQNITQVGGSLLTLGQKTMVNSIPVVIALDQSSIPVQLVSSTIKTYSASVKGLATAVLGATDIFTITGSGTQTVKVKKIRVTVTRSSSTTNNVLLIKRSTANSGGTSSAAIAVSHDSNNAAATATVLSYTANPTLGTAVGTMRVQKQFANVLATGSSDVINWEFGQDTSQGITLRGTSQVLAVNLNGTIITTPSYDIYIEWTEE